MSQINKKIGFLFLQGAGLQSSIWNNVLEKLPYPYLLIDSPQPKTNKKLTLDEYSMNIKQAVEKWEVEKIVIVAHSIGGVVALKCANLMQDRVVGLIAIGAAIPKDGGSFLSIFPYPKSLLMHIILRLFGTKPPESAIRQGLCSDIPESKTKDIIDNFVVESLHLYTDQTNVSSPNVSKMYVKLSEDKELDNVLQEKMIHNLNPDQIVELDTGHLPMISRSGELSGILLDFINKMD
ncbi:alpha/beta fold hydrolase [Shimazuella kribbensis]|uniref:alpha/beta fold hydrolase n=1 Tax=Shimazuella kribbensis TaxID=139808 RepID=UPI000418613E|nr:alpha/beta hydrolase [Shimazuella kribbensis]